MLVVLVRVQMTGRALVSTRVSDRHWVCCATAQGKWILRKRPLHLSFSLICPPLPMLDLSWVWVQMAQELVPVLHAISEHPRQSLEAPRKVSLERGYSLLLSFAGTPLNQLSWTQPISMPAIEGRDKPYPFPVASLTDTHALSWISWVWNKEQVMQSGGDGIFLASCLWAICRRVSLQLSTAPRGFLHSQIQKHALLRNGWRDWREQTDSSTPTQPTRKGLKFS